MRSTLLVLIAVLMLTACSGSGSGSSPPNNSSSIVNNLAGNQAPTISGLPPTGVKFGEEFEFEPGAGDADGDKLTFSIEGKPDWATFDAATGRLSGQPEFSDIGDYENIVITVSDSQTNTALPPFTLSVSQTALASITLNWQIPTLNTDGSPLQDLAGFSIYYWRDSGITRYYVKIDNPGITTFVVEQLSPGTYYFAATAINRMGIESALSGEIVGKVD